MIKYFKNFNIQFTDGFMVNLYQKCSLLIYFLMKIEIMQKEILQNSVVKTLYEKVELGFESFLKQKISK